MKELVFEVGTEEMPAGFIPQALKALEERFSRWLEEERIGFEGLRALGTPRRLALVALLEEIQRPLETLKVGPPKKVAFDLEGRPTKAAEGFARQYGLSPEDLVVVETEKGEYVAVKLRAEGRPTAELLREFLPRLILEIPLPKAMRWSDKALRFIRPVHWILAVFGGEPLSLELDGIPSGSMTYGHRFMAPGPIEVRDIKGYIEGLRGAFVLVDPEERRGRIREEVERAARSVGGTPLLEEGLLEEVTNMVEWPVAVAGRFDPTFLSLPREVLITAMEHHQRYFPVVDPEGQLLPHFVAVSNTLARDMEVVRRGNERVLKARLEDARFFYQEDLKVPLKDRVERLKGVIFQAKLGTLYDKAERLVGLSARLAEVLCPAKVELVRRAALLCKADLVTEMVGEFPELQGVMGREYALKSGEDPEVAQAIFEHYLPRFSGDRLPETETGAILSLAEKLDNLVGCFSVGLLPTGTSDPFALRRQAMGLIQILMAKGYRLSLKEAIGWAFELLGARAERPEARDEVLAFILGRFEGIMASEGYEKGEIAAVLEVQGDDLVDASKRIRALHAFRSTEDFESLAIAFKRVANILKGQSYPDSVEEDLLKEREEEALYRAYLAVKKRVEPLLEKEDYQGALSVLVELRPTVDLFFDKVLVMTEEKALRENRLALLGALWRLFRGIADISKVAP